MDGWSAGWSGEVGAAIHLILPDASLCLNSPSSLLFPSPLRSTPSGRETPHSHRECLISFFVFCGCNHGQVTITENNGNCFFFFLILSRWIYKRSGKLLNFIQQRKVGALWPRVLCLSRIARRSAPEWWACTSIIKRIHFNWAVGEIGAALTHVNTVIEKKKNYCLKLIAPQQLRFC